MSVPGDVVWADSAAWMRTDWDEKSRWITEAAREENRATLEHLKKCADFVWLVKNSVLQTGHAHTVLLPNSYEPDSQFHDWYDD